MKLFKGHAVMPRAAGEPGHLVRTYLVTAGTWEDALHRIRACEPHAEFVTIPDEVPEPVMLGTRRIDARERNDLLAATAWNEERLRRRVV